MSSYNPTTRKEAEARTYGRLSHAYKPGQCAESVSGADIWSGSHQCNRKAVAGPEKLYCGQHDPAAKKAKADAREAADNARWLARDAQAELTTDRRKAFDTLVEVAHWFSGDRLHFLPKYLADEIADNRSVQRELAKSRA